MGALTGLLGIELTGQGPVPFTAALLAGHGADIVRVTAPARQIAAGLGGAAEPMLEGRRVLELDLKDPPQRRVLLELVAGADFLIEGYRPGVMERLGLGPEVCLERNPQLVYARITGWGQEGPLAARAGHDIDYIALTGALAAIGTHADPTPPLNLVGDYAGGAMFAAFGIVAALLERQRSGLGEVVDAAIVDGVGFLMAPFFDLMAGGAWTEPRGANVLDGGAPFYAVHRTSDGEHMAVGALEAAFFDELCRVLGIAEHPFVQRQYDRSTWPAMAEVIGSAFASATRAEWEARFAAVDACVAPVLSMAEAPSHPHHQARNLFIFRDGRPTPDVAPRFARTPGGRAKPASPADDAFLQRFHDAATRRSVTAARPQPDQA